MAVNFNYDPSKNSSTGDEYSSLKNQSITLDSEYLNKMNKIEADHKDRLFQEKTQKALDEGKVPLLASNGTLAGLSSLAMSPNVTSLSTTPTKKKRNRPKAIIRNKQGKNPFKSTNPKNIKINNKEYSKDSLTLKFDGSRLKVLSDNNEVYSLPAVSGKEGYQTKKYQSIKNTGPIPEGDYILKQKDYHEMGFGSNALGYVSAVTNAIGLGKHGSWTGGKAAWGDKKISITKEAGTNTFGRDGFNIHGGDDPGSAGCIDLTKYNNTFMQIFRATEKDLKLKVQY